MSFSDQVSRVIAQVEERGSDPWRQILERALPPSLKAISTVHLLDLIGLPHTTGAARRISPTMRNLGWVPIKSRRLPPGGHRDTKIRGWARTTL
jgi:hypothetical protein